MAWRICSIDAFQAIGRDGASNLEVASGFRGVSSLISALPENVRNPLKPPELRATLAFAHGEKSPYGLGSDVAAAAQGLPVGCFPPRASWRLRIHSR